MIRQDHHRSKPSLINNSINFGYASSYIPVPETQLRPFQYCEDDPPLQSLEAACPDCLFFGCCKPEQFYSTCMDYAPADTYTDEYVGRYIDDKRLDYWKEFVADPIWFPS